MVGCRYMEKKALFKNIDNFESNRDLFINFAFFQAALRVRECEKVLFFLYKTCFFAQAVV